jgi:ParB/RepB/Spo0J family partition protein
MESAGGTRKISLAQIIETGNVREDYVEIGELAESIRRNGLLQPIAVKPAGRDTYGIEQYELIAGHRRYRAFQSLFNRGEDFSMIDAVVVSGDKLTLQLIENLQRSDLTAMERERGIYEMTRRGEVSQREVAALLGKNEQYVSRHIAAFKVRTLATSENIDCAGVGTYALCEIQAAPAVDYPLLIRRLVERGGASSAAREIMREYRGESERSSPIGSLSQSAPPKEERQMGTINPAARSVIRCAPVERKPAIVPNAMPVGNAVSQRERLQVDFYSPGKTVELNEVFLIIKEYTDIVGKKFGGNELKDKIDASWDIIALLHKAVADGRL